MSELMPSLARILVLLVALYAVCAVGAHYLSLDMMFPRPPVSYSRGPDYIELRAPDGTVVMARYWPNPSARHTLLYLHGNYEDLGTVGEYVPGLVDAGYAVLAIDYRRYGLSGGVPNEANLYADTELAYEYLRTKLGVPAERIVPFGYSLGGGPAVELARRRPVGGLILQGAFVSAYRVMTRIPLFPADKFENLKKMPSIRCPVLVIHGTADNTVPGWHGEALYAAATARKAKFIVEGGPHAGLADFAGPRYAQELRKFTDSL
jgi:fermentation-respiration switch protein FrsA (DUF1100 family)